MLPVAEARTRVRATRLFILPEEGFPAMKNLIFSRACFPARYRPFLSAMIVGNDFQLFPLAFIRASGAGCESTTSLVGLTSPIRAQSPVSTPRLSHQPGSSGQGRGVHFTFPINIIYRSSSTGQIILTGSGGLRELVAGSELRKQ